MVYILLAVFVVILTLFLRFIIGVEPRTLVTLYLLGLVIFLLSFTVAEMPAFGSLDNPTFNEVPARYLEQGVAETGAVNIVAGVIIDYRAFDTFGEATVLFVAIAAVVATLRSH